MRDVGDNEGEMRGPRPGLDDEAIESLLAGDAPADEELADLAVFVDALRGHAVAAPPPRPSAELAALLSDGLTATEPPIPAPVEAVRPPAWGRRRRMVLETALAKLTALGLTAKVGVATAAVAAATTGAGAAGALPGPVQDAVADAVGAVTPFQLPSGGTDDGLPTENATEDPTPSTTEQASDDPTDDPTDGPSEASTSVEEESTAPDDRASFGERVSGDATGEDDGEPGVDGQEISSEASEHGQTTAEEHRPADPQRTGEPSEHPDAGLDADDDGDDGEGDDDGDEDGSEHADERRPDDPAGERGPQDTPARD